MLVPLSAAQSAHAATARATAVRAAAVHVAAVHVANPYVGSTPYLNPDYVSEVDAQAAVDGGAAGAAEAKVAGYQTAIWMDHIGAITGDSTHLGLKAQLDDAEAQAAKSTQPVLFEVVVYDLPGRDCAALASNGEIPATAAGLTEYETQYIDPIAALLGNSAYSNLRISAIIEPDSLPNAVTNQSKAACATAAPYYETGIEYALNKLHPISNLYTYLDIGHAGWLGWTSNMTPAAQEYAKVAKATTAGFASVDGFISDTANYTPTEEPYLPNPTLQVGGSPLDSVNFYQYNPAFDEHSYDEAMHAALVAAGFPSTVGMLIDTSRNGWGGPARPTALNSSPTTATAYVAANKIDQRPFRGDWCNIQGAGIGARPTAQPYGAADPIIAFVWIKPPGESDGDYPTSSHTHGDPHCDPNGTQTDGNGGTYPTDAIPGYDVPAGQWFAAEFQQLVADAYPALGASTGGGDTTPPSVPTGLTVTGTTGSSVSLSWTASTDNVGVTGYDVYRGGTRVATVTSDTGYTDTGLTAGTAYSYTVDARDAAGNVSAASAAVTATTASSGGGGGTGSSGCTAAYSVSSDWGSGFNAAVTVTNTGTATTKSWTVSWSWPGNQQIGNLWNGSWSQSGASVTVTAASYNNAVAAGGSTGFGFGGTYSGANTAPVLSCTAS
ncbi:glycoside hydrolase [Streptacidiphilus sp. PB12-B1b]|nr:glycoside hydrolase [Streptacidiphilus sp. PB12-B1b]